MRRVCCRHPADPSCAERRRALRTFCRRALRAEPLHPGSRRPTRTHWRQGATLGRHWRQGAAWAAGALLHGVKNVSQLRNQPTK